MVLEKDFKKLTPKQRLYYKVLFQKDFYSFTKYFWCEADPAELIDGFLIKFNCEFFQYMCRQWIGYEPLEQEPILPEPDENTVIIDVRQNKKNANINMPPRHSKSMILNVLAGVWIWLNEPLKLASISHTGQLAGIMNTKRQKILNSERFKFFFPEIELITNTAYMLINSKAGELYSINRNAATGYGADIIICDDLTNAETARKDKDEMNNAWAFYQNTLPSRINDRNKYIIFNIQQRLAPNDITGRIMSNSSIANQYIFVTLPAQFSKTTYIVLPISGEVVKFEKGDYLWPERFGDYSGLRAEVGESIWQTQYLQNPIATDKTYIKEDMLREEDATNCVGWNSSLGAIDELNVDMIYASHDFPIKDKVTSDFLGSILAYRVKRTLYIVDCLEIKQDFSKNLEYVKSINNTYLGCIQIIEDKANGSPLLNVLQDEVPGMQPYNPGSNSKEERLASATPWILSGNVVFVKSKFNKATNKWELSPALQNLKSRLINFPFVEHDDIIDALSMLILYIFLDLKYCVYGRSFNDFNIISKDEIKVDYTTIFFNKEGDTWKILEIGISYDIITKLIVLREEKVIASMKEGLKKLKEFAPDKNVFIDCSFDSLGSLYTDNTVIEHYNINDFEKSVIDLNLALSNKKILLDTHCKLTKGDLENFKYDKKIPGKFITEKDGFIACLRTAMTYFGGIN